MPTIEDVQAVLEKDPATRASGIEIVGAHADGIELTLTVSPEHGNSVGVCHGGVVFTLADAASGLLANSAPGENWVTIDSQIRYTAPARQGDELLARCDRRWSTRSDFARFETKVFVGDSLIAIVDATMKQIGRREG